MSNALRLSEKWFRRGLWLVAFVFASFLIGLGGSLVGDYTELVELMELNADGKVKMHYSRYALDDINTAIDDFKNRRFTGRGVIVP